MKKKFTLLLSMLLLVGTGSVWAEKVSIDISSAEPTNGGSKATWNSSTNTISWDQGGSAGNNAVYLVNYGKDNAKNYQNYFLTIKTDNFTNTKSSETYRILYYYYDYDSVNDKYVEKSKLLGSPTKEGTFIYKLNGSTAASISAFGIAGPSGSTDAEGSVKVNEIYLVKVDAPQYDNYGEYCLDLSKLTAEDGLSYSYSSGVGTLSATASTAGTLTYDFGDDIFDLSGFTSFEVTCSSGDNKTTNSLTFYQYDSSKSATINDSRFSWTPNSKTEAQNTALSALGKLVWSRTAENSNTGDVKITSIKFKRSDIITSTLPGYTIVAKSMFKDYSSDASGAAANDAKFNMNIKNSTIIGYDTPNYQKYIDATGYNKIVITGSVGDKIRIFYPTNAESTSYAGEQTIPSSGVLELDLATSTNDTYKICAVKANNGGSSTVYSIQLYKTPTTTYSYVLAGSGTQTSDATAALADATATSIDATGLTNSTAIALTTANPNCMIYAESGKVSNANNVVVDGTCANLVLTDAKPFKAPTAFTATNATFSKTVNAAGASTMVLPFAVDALPTGVEAYKLTAVAGEKATASPVSSIDANQPVLLNKAGNYDFTATSATIGATGDDPVNGDGSILYGVYASQYVPANSYVLQNGNDGLGFYKVAAENTININPFRAYLTAPAAGARSYIGFDLDDDELTGIKMVQHEGAKAEGADTCYDLSGRRVAQPTKGLYIVNGKKYVVK